MPDHGMCCTRWCHQPTSDGRKKVSGPGKSSQAYADCLAGSPYESSQQARQVVEATSAAPRDPFLELALVSNSLFGRPLTTENQHNDPCYHQDKDQNAFH